MDRNRPLSTSALTPISSPFLALTASKKGGVGKTTTALAIADLATLNDLKLTVIQVDDQARLEQTIKRAVISIKLPFREARRNPALLTMAFDALYSAIELIARSGPSVLIDLGPTEVDYFIEWARLVDLDEDLRSLGIPSVVFVPAVAEPESLRQAGRTLCLFAEVLPSINRVFVENQRDGGLSELADGSEAERVWRHDLEPILASTAVLTAPAIEAGSWRHFERGCHRFIDVVTMDVDAVMRVTGLSRPQAKLARGDVAHFFNLMEGALARVLPLEGGRSMSSTPEFRAATHRAIQDRAEALEGIARQLASEFLADPAKFDPEGLSAIGRAGLRRFLGHLGTEPDLLLVNPAFGSTPQPEARPAEGWTHDPEISWPPLPRALALGFGSGLLTIGISAAVLALS